MSRRVVRYWEKWRGEEADALARLVSEFNRSQDAYRVVVEEFGDWSSSPDMEALETARSAGAMPDLLGLENPHLPALASDGALHPLDGYVDPDHLDVFHPRALEVCRFGGQHFGLPISTNLGFLVINREVVEGTGLVNDAPSSISTFDAAVDELDNRGRTGFVPTYPGWWPHVWPWLFDGGWYDELGRFDPVHEGNIRAYEWMCSFATASIRRRFPEIINPIGSPPQPFFDGDVAIVFDGEHLVHRLLRHDVSWSPAPLPSLDGEGRVLLEADVLAVPEGTEQFSGAMAFVEFLTDATRLEQLALGHGKGAPTRDWSSEFVEDHPNPHVGRVRSLMRTVPVIAEPARPDWIGQRARIEDAVEAMWVDGIGVREALDGLDR